MGTTRIRIQEVKRTNSTEGSADGKFLQANRRAHLSGKIQTHWCTALFAEPGPRLGSSSRAQTAANTSKAEVARNGQEDGQKERQGTPGAGMRMATAAAAETSGRGASQGWTDSASFSHDSRHSPERAKAPERADKAEAEVQEGEQRTRRPHSQP